MVKRIVRKGEGEFPMDCPLEDSRVRVHYRCAFLVVVVCMPVCLCSLLPLLARPRDSTPICLQGESTGRGAVVARQQGGWPGSSAGV